MKKTIVLTINLLVAFLSIIEAQKYDNVFYNGYNKIQGTDLYEGYILDFKSSPPVISEHLIPIITDERNLCLSDYHGNPKLITNGVQITDFEGNLIQNGDNIDSLSPGGTFGIPLRMLAIPLISDSNSFHLFHPYCVNCGSSVLTGRSHTIIMMTDSGYVVPPGKKRQLLQANAMRNFIVRHANGKDWWIAIGTFPDTIITGIPVYPSLMTYNYYLTQGESIIYSHQQTMSEISGVSYSNSVSPDGQKFAIGSYHTYLDINTPPFYFFDKAFVTYYDFDRCSGLFVKQVVIDFPVNNLFDDSIQGVVFSPNSKLLYVSTSRILYQIDMDILSQGIVSLDTVALFDGYMDNDGVPAFLICRQNAPDGKIYIQNNTKTLGVIEKPNKKGIACNVRQHILNTPARGADNFGFHPNYRLGPIDGSPCDTLGIDNHPLADFWWFGDSTLTVEFADNSSYEPATWFWNFDDNSTSQDTSPYHTFPAAGIYNVCLTVCNQFSCDTICKDVSVGGFVKVGEPIESKYFIELFPNPANDIISIRYDIENENQIIEFFDLTGRKIREELLTNKKGEANLSINNFVSGIYFYRVRLTANTYESGKLIVQK